MDLDKMKERVKRVNAPAVGRGTTMDSLVEALKAEDERDRKTHRRMMVFFAVAGTFYLGLFILMWFAPPDDFPSMHRAVGALVATALLGLGVLSMRRVRTLERVDYTESASKFLAGVEERYQFLRSADLLVRGPLALAFVIASTAGLILAMARYFPSLDPSVGLVVSAVIFSGALGSGIAFEWARWKRDKEPLLREIRSIREGLERQ